MTSFRRRQRSSSSSRQKLVPYAEVICCFLTSVTVIWIVSSLQYLRQQFLTSNVPSSSLLLRNDVSYQVHAFYYPWYCNPQVDGRFLHWNHQILPHWEERVNQQFPSIGTEHDASRGDIGASFYPQLGLYSSADPTVIDHHMQMMVDAGIGVVVVSWLPSHQHDANGPPIAQRLGPLLEAAQRFQLGVAVHMEPYDDRTAASLRKDIEEILNEHGESPGLYRLPRPGHTKPLPVLYVYDQYRIPSAEFQSLLKEQQFSGNRFLRRESTGSTRGKENLETIRGTRYDAVLLALIVEQRHWDEYVEEAGFDGGYTYFASDTFTYGSRPSNWLPMQQQAERSHKYFVPCVGPGYDDTRVRPWNSENTKERKGGEYFSKEWEAAIRAGATLVAVTSFNEWHEGTQIEPAESSSTRSSSSTNVVSSSSTNSNPHHYDHVYKDYKLEGGPSSYLQLNKQWVESFQASRNGLNVENFLKRIAAGSIR